MRTVAYLTVVAFSGFAHAAPVPVHLMREPTDLDRLQGNWQHESTVVCTPGVKRTSKEQAKTVWEIRGGRITQHTATDVTHAYLNLTTVGGAKRFGIVDVSRADWYGESIAPNQTEVLEFGYAIEGDTLRLASNYAKPVDLAKPDEFYEVLVLKRVKDKN